MKLHSHLVEGKLFNNMIIQFSKKFNEFNPLVSTYFCIDIDPLWIAKWVYYGFGFDIERVFSSKQELYGFSFSFERDIVFSSKQDLYGFSFERDRVFSSNPCKFCEEYTNIHSLYT